MEDGALREVGSVDDADGAGPIGVVSERTALELRGLVCLAREGLAYQKAGVMLGGLQPRAGLTESLFGRSERLMAVLDDVNRRLGPDTLRYAAAGPCPPKRGSAREGGSRPWHMRHEHASPRYTTRWDELPTARAD